jgi:hypothetical protein
LLEVDANIGNGQLRVKWTYSENVHQRSTIEGLAADFSNALHEIASFCRSPEASAFTPSDFPLASLNQQQVDMLVEEIGHVEDIYPLSPMQQGLLFHSLLGSAASEYFEQLTCRLFGHLNVDAFEQAWQGVIRRHGILRTSFVWERLAKPLQVVHQAASLPLEIVDWQGVGEEEQGARLEQFLKEDQQRSFHFTEAPLMRLTLIAVSPEVHQLVWSHHHLLLDGWSLPLVLTEVFAGYAAAAEGQTLQLPGARPYRDYISWLQAQDMEGAERFWRSTLAGFGGPTPLPEGGQSGGQGVRSGAEREAAGSERGERQVWFKRETSQRLEEYGRRHQVTANTIMQGAWAVLLARHSGEREVVYGVTVSGRPAELAGVERMVGLFINTLPVRVRVDGGTEVAEWLRRLQAEQVELRQYEYSPLVEVAGWSEVERGVGLFESLLVFENYPVEEELRQGASERRAGLEIGAARAVERTNYPLTVVCGPGERLSVRISYAAGRYEGAAVERMLGQLERIVEGMVGDAGVRVQELELVSGEEREQLLGGWNETGAAYGVERTLAELFEEQVERAGAAVALESETEELSYAELNERANQVGHYLREQGVGPEVLVGLLMERGIELVVGLLGVLKAGGAYVPLDPAYPQERLSFMMADAGVKVLLTQQKLVAHLPVQEVKLVCIDSDSESIAEQSVENIESGPPGAPQRRGSPAPGRRGARRGPRTPPRAPRGPCRGPAC